MKLKITTQVPETREIDIEFPRYSQFGDTIRRLDADGTMYSVNSTRDGYELEITRHDLASVQWPAETFGLSGYECTAKEFETALAAAKAFIARLGQ